MFIESKFKVCGIANTWQFSHNLPTMSTDWYTWYYDKIVKCPKLDMDNITYRKSFIHIQCNTTKLKYGNKIQSFQHDIKCIDYYIKHCCTDNMAVPNIVHYIWFGLSQRFDFYGFLSFISVLRFVKPRVILVHGDNLPRGSYWMFILYIYPKIIHVKRSVEIDVIYGKKPCHVNHFSDLFRIEALLKYGGIYFDMDMVLVKEIDFLRKYPCSHNVSTTA
jgi:hypothetical protein